MKLALALISLFGSIFIWWVKQDDAKKKEIKERKQEIKDAVFSCDVARINAVVMRLRK